MKWRGETTGKCANDYFERIYYFSILAIYENGYKHRFPCLFTLIAKVRIHNIRFLVGICIMFPFLSSLIIHFPGECLCSREQK